VDPAQVTQNRDAWYVLAVESQHTTGLGTQGSGAVGRGDMSVDVLVLQIIGCGDLRQQPCHNFDDIRHWHRTNFVLPSDFLPPPPRPTSPL
jgi:hypothetical protein